MSDTPSFLKILESEKALSDKLFQDQQLQFHKRTDKLFATLMLGQWVAAIIMALVLTPKTWSGSISDTHIHVWVAILIGGAISLFPVFLAWTKPGARTTRHIIAASQMCMSALLIHLSGGRIETHFHVFGSLALLAFYLDWQVLITASLVVALDHAARGIFWPQSVYGVMFVEPFRWLEHTGWVVFEDVFLCMSIRHHIRALEENCAREAKLEKTNEQIEAIVTERTAELAEINLKLQELSLELSQSRDDAIQASRFKGDFLANMSHEIRTPLNAVIGLSDLLMRTPLSDEQREFGAIINNSADLLLDLVNDILDYSKIEAGKLDLELIEFDIIELIEGTSEIVNERAHTKNLTLSSFIDPTISRIVKGDPGRIRQVLLNFLSNSIKFTEQGEIVVQAMAVGETENGRLEVKFSVKDTGIGLSEVAREKLFQPFTQADNSITRKYGGTGLGLAISDKLVALMGGTIDFESVYGKGSIFSFSIKLDTVLKEPGQSMSCPINEFNAKRLLIVDGPEGIQNVLQSYASIMGVRTSVASDIGKALPMLKKEVAEKDPFDVALFIMNSENEEALRNFKDLKHHLHLNKTKLAVVASSNEKDFVQQIMQNDLSHFFVTPVKKNKFVEGLISLIKQKSKESQEAKNSEPDASLPPDSTSLVLVVEDNAANQKVALLQLRELGLPAHAVGNGIEALEAVARTQYALILMDCQMPEMDGIQATKEIRKMEQQTGKRSPIVAMTAHAMASDRIECLTAGMDDYISKPVTQKKLSQIIERWMPRSPGVSPEKDNQEITGEISSNKRPIEIETLKKTFGLKVAGELMQEFLDDTMRLLQKLDHDLASNDLVALRMDVHELKGMSASLYASEIAEMSRLLEEQLENEKANWKALQLQVDEIRSARIRAKSYIEEKSKQL